MATIVTLLGKVECVKPPTESESESKTVKIWSVQGSWAFGEKDPAPIVAASAAQQEQQQQPPASLPFSYTFERVVDARMTPIPSLQPPEEQLKPPATTTTTTTTAPQQQHDSAATTPGTATLPPEKPTMESTRQDNTPKPVDIDTPKIIEKEKPKTEANNTNETNAIATHEDVATQKDSGPQPGTGKIETKQASNAKNETEVGEKTTTKISSTVETAKTTQAVNDNNTPAETTTTQQKPKGPTFGDDGFVDACTKYPLCPPSGRWRGSFHAATGRKGSHQQAIREYFDLFLYAQPPPDAQVQFSNPRAELPKEHIYVRGAGENQFGLFELLGTYSLATHELRVQRLYVRIAPEPPRRGRGRRPKHHGTVNIDTNAGRSTRKRQLSWKRKAMDETSTTATMGSGGTSVVTGEDGRPAKRQKRKRADETASVATTTTTGAAVSTGGTSGIPRTVDTSGGGSTSATVTPKAPAAAPSSRLSMTPHGSTVVRLPVEGDVNQARWRAAHFYHYNPAPKDTASAAAAASGNNTAASSIKSVVYEGELYDGLREGRGVCVYNNDMVYEGEWQRDKEHGYGTLWTGDKKRIIYQGEWERGKMHGQGKYYYYSSFNRAEESSRASKIQSRYEGEFRENLRHGTGMYVLPDGSTYNGSWQNGAMNGRGVFTWPDGSVYDGEWKDNKRHGQGMLTASDGFVYDGSWVQNTIDGRGVARYPDGQEYHGIFSNGRREGRGTIKFPNGAIYEGRFRDDAVDGQGTMKIRKAVLIPRDENGDEDLDDDDGDQEETTQQVDKEEEAKASEKTEEEPKSADFMIPISFQSDMGHIHRKAGFTLGGI